MKKSRSSNGSTAVRRSKRLAMPRQDRAEDLQRDDQALCAVQGDSDGPANFTLTWPLPGGQHSERAANADDKPSEDPQAECFNCEPQPCMEAELNDDSESCGLWAILPDELLEIILRQCSAPQLAMLESTCRFWRGNKLIEKIVRHKLKLIPRARGLKPNKKEGETYSVLLHYVNCQSAAAAQATSIACGAYHTTALLVPTDSTADVGQPRHSLHTFGRGFHGQLGDHGFVSRKTPVRISLGYRPSADNADVEEETMPAVVGCGSHHSTAISRKGELYSWGLGCHGELGLGRWGPIELNAPRQCSSAVVRIVSVACGGNHTLAIAENGVLWSCGRNHRGQLGNNSTVDGSRLQMVAKLSGYRIVSSAAGAAHSLALASDGSLFTWGDGSRGQLGHSHLQSPAESMLPAEGTVTVSTATKIARLDPVALPPDCRVTAIAAGGNHSLALTVGGGILAFGANDQGQLGLGDCADRWKPTRVSQYGTLDRPCGTLDRQGCLRVVQLAGGLAHTVALFSIGGKLQVRTTGGNSHGQLGLNDRTNRNLFTHVTRLVNPAAVQAGDEHTAAVLATGELLLWGRGDCGQLGTGDGRSKWKPTLVKGFHVVHPDKTLRRNKRLQPLSRPVQRDKSTLPCAGAPCM